MNRLNRLLMSMSALALAAIVLLTCVDVISSNFWGRPITGIYEVVEVSLVFLVFLGIPDTFRADRNITVDVIDHFIGPGSIAILRSLAAVISMAFLAMMQWCFLQPAIDSVRFGDIKSDTGIPLWIVWVPILLGTLLAIIGAALTTVGALTRYRRARTLP